MVKIAYTSDLHLEFYQSSKHNDLFKRVLNDINSRPADVLVLAGDICAYGAESVLQEFLHKVRPNFGVVIAVSGNHDYYGASESRSLLQEFDDPSWGILLLDKDYATYNGLKFAGCTLWYPLPKGHSGMSDSYVIPNAHEFTTGESKLDHEFLKSLDRDTDVLVTHVPTDAVGMNPNDSIKSIRFNQYYHQDVLLPETDQKLIAISGHTHYRLDTNDWFPNVRYLSHAAGYPHQLEWPITKTIEVEVK